MRTAGFLRGTRRATPIVATLFCGVAGWATNALSQEVEEIPATPDSVFSGTYTRPVAYYTTYDRDRSNGTWSQSLTFGVTRRRLAFNTSGSVSTIDDVTRPGFGGSNGRITGRLDLRPVPRWVFSLDGRFDKLASGDKASTTRQRRNRFLVQTQYTLSPLRNLTALALVSSEFQQDQNLSFRPLPDVRKVVGVDTFFIHDQRDSSFMSARQDGATGTVKWKAAEWLTLDGVAIGSRVRPTTRSYLRDFVRPLGGGEVEQVDAQRIENENSNTKYRSTLSLEPKPTFSAKLEVTKLELDQSYFDKQLRGQEHRTFGQRSGTLHVQQVPRQGFVLMLDGTLSRTLGEYALRTTNTSLVNKRGLSGSLSYSGPREARGSVSLALDRSRNERQTSQNGLTISRFLNANGGRRVSERLSLDCGGSVSLLSYKYEDAVSDRDNVRASTSVGGRYEVSPYCNTIVHFSVNRGHSIAIDPSASGNNVVETLYQMDASLSVRAGPNLTVNQNYVLNALYQIYDYAEPRNTLNRIRRIDTVISDTLFAFAHIDLTHNFLFRDSGTYRRPIAGADREYATSVETYQQNLGVSLGIQPMRSVLFKMTQSLANTRNHFLATGLRSVSNRWDLILGAEVDRPLAGGASIRGAVRHIGGYNERQLPTEPFKEEKYWIAGVTFQKSFE